MEGLGNDGGFAPQATGARRPAATLSTSRRRERRGGLRTPYLAARAAGMTGECQGGSYATLRRLMEEKPFGAGG